jgi:pimeloyl-ACP methyl ester carboxylesterase
VPNKYFQIEGVATYVYHEGSTTLPEEPPSQEAGEVVLCLHGEGGNGAQFGGLLPAVAVAHSPLGFDQPGHHRSGELDSLGDIGRLAEFTGSFTDQLGLRPHVVLGHAMGAAIALRHALERPNDVRALVLCSAGDLLPISDGNLETFRLISEGKRRREFNPKLYS